MVGKVENLRKTLPSIKEINMFQVSRHPKFSQFVIKRKGAGVLPEELSGLYTNHNYADADIKRYKQKMAEEESKALDRKEKQVEIDKKPLSDTQRNKRNAKKPSPPRK